MKTTLGDQALARTIVTSRFAALLVVGAAIGACKREPATDSDRQRSPIAAIRAVEHAVATFRPLPQIPAGATVGGVVHFRLTGAAARMTGTITGLSPGAHGLHIHENGDCSAADGSSAGGHFNPGGDPHGAPSAPIDQRHVGDLGNVEAGADRRAAVDMTLDPSVLREGERNILGRSLIVHAGRDDLTSQPAGSSGDRIGCAVIRAGTAAEEDKAPRVPAP